MLVAADNGDSFVVHAIAHETGQQANRMALRNPEALLPLTSGKQSRRLSRTEVEAVVAGKEKVVQVALEEWSQRYGLSWEAGPLQTGQRRKRLHKRHPKLRQKEN